MPLPGTVLPSMTSSASLCGTFTVRRVLTWAGAFAAGAWVNTRATAALCIPATSDNATNQRRMMMMSPAFVGKRDRPDVHRPGLQNRHAAPEEAAYVRPNVRREFTAPGAYRQDAPDRLSKTASGNSIMTARLTFRRTRRSRIPIAFTSGDTESGETP